MSEKLLKQILTEITGIKSEVTGINNEITGIKNEIIGINNEITGMKNEIISINNEITGMKNEITSIKNDQATMKSQLEENTQLTKAIFNRQEETDAKLENLSIDVHKIHGDLSSLKVELRDIKNEVTFTYQKTSKNELDIFKLQQIHEH